MARILQVRGWRRAVAAQLTIDESTAVALGQPDAATQRVGFWATGLSVYVFWNAMTLAGALLGNAVGDPKAWGLDAAASGAFMALLRSRLNTRAARVTALAAAGVALAALVAVQTFDAGGAVRLDARAAGLVAAVVALMLRAPFLLVIVMAAATAAALRALGIG